MDLKLLEELIVQHEERALQLGMASSGRFELDELRFALIDINALMPQIALTQMDSLVRRAGKVLAELHGVQEAWKYGRDSLAA